MSALWFVVAWVGVSVLCVAFFAVGAALGYRRGWDERSYAHTRAGRWAASDSRREDEWVRDDRVRVPSR